MAATRAPYRQGTPPEYLKNECTCKEGLDWIDPHPCPFAQEIHDNSDNCMCCPECTYQCAMDI